MQRICAATSLCWLLLSALDYLSAPLTTKPPSNSRKSLTARPSRNPESRLRPCGASTDERCSKGRHGCPTGKSARLTATVDPSSSSSHSAALSSASLPGSVSGDPSSVLLLPCSNGTCGCCCCSTPVLTGWSSSSFCCCCWCLAAAAAAVTFLHPRSASSKLSQCALRWQHTSNQLHEVQCRPRQCCQHKD